MRVLVPPLAGGAGGGARRADDAVTSGVLGLVEPTVGAGQRPIRLYRIYRDSGTSLTDRYDVTVDASTTWTDPKPGPATAHRYWVTAVDSSNNESNPSNAVDSP